MVFNFTLQTTNDNLFCITHGANITSVFANLQPCNKFNHLRLSNEREQQQKSAESENIVIEAE